MIDASNSDLPVEPAPPSVVGIMLRWLLGPAVFVAHLATFLVAGATLLAIDLLQDPGAVWSTTVLLRWVAVIGVHALVATIGWAVAFVIDAARAAEDDLDRDHTFSAPPAAVAEAIAPSPEPAVVAIDWSEHIASNAPAAALPGSRLPVPGAPLAPRLEHGIDDAVAAALDADSAVLERSAPFDPLPAATGDHLPPPAPPEPMIPAGAPPRARFSPPATTPAAPEPSEGRKPRWYDRHRKKDDVPPQQSDTTERTPPGWRVITPETEPTPAAPLPPSPTTSKPGDESWTWIEAAAQAWLEHRAEATGTTGRPPAPAPDAAGSNTATSEDSSDDAR